MRKKKIQIKEKSEIVIDNGQIMIFLNHIDGTCDLIIIEDDLSIMTTYKEIENEITDWNRYEIIPIDGSPMSEVLWENEFIWGLNDDGRN